MSERQTKTVHIIETTSRFSLTPEEFKQAFSVPEGAEVTVRVHDVEGDVWDLYLVDVARLEVLTEERTVQTVDTAGDTEVAA